MDVVSTGLTVFHKLFLRNRFLNSFLFLDPLWFRVTFWKIALRLPFQVLLPDVILRPHCGTHTFCSQWISLGQICKSSSLRGPTFCFLKTSGASNWSWNSLPSLHPSEVVHYLSLQHLRTRFLCSLSSLKFLSIYVFVFVFKTVGISRFVLDEKPILHCRDIILFVEIYSNCLV